MLKDSIAQADKARLEWMLQQVEDHVARLREERSRLAPDSLEWGWVDEALFEARSLRRNLRTALRMAGSLFECERCGAIHNPEWVAAYGLRCDAECDGRLREVEV
ncbi:MULTISPECIES: hypothetical protein [unclassified Meiothermus]|uniref:hypothetical protein n=1 Tax=unclassified Meiothermus TaxID=370471 RepID=UPI000D7BFA0F|nr:MULTISPECIES: hypothetical protein [unclassified Meiothermus]PZA08622.1 hypothetical protein DNA98_00800 [Meiothermus sp. Pnk-1]RYM40759.1 hypothetical protein EWH23_01135 [Meiothermus sp. PNK-Is4]